MSEITKTLISRKTLAERWDFSSQSILKYEQDGILTRNPNFGSTKILYGGNYTNRSTKGN